MLWTGPPVFIYNFPNVDFDAGFFKELTCQSINGRLAVLNLSPRKFPQSPIEPVLPTKNYERLVVS